MDVQELRRLMRDPVGGDQQLLKLIAALRNEDQEAPFWQAVGCLFGFAPGMLGATLARRKEAASSYLRVRSWEGQPNAPLKGRNQKVQIDKVLVKLADLVTERQARQPSERQHRRQARNRRVDS